MRPHSAEIDPYCILVLKVFVQIQHSIQTTSCSTDTITGSKWNRWNTTCGSTHKRRFKSHLKAPKKMVYFRIWKMCAGVQSLLGDTGYGITRYYSLQMPLSTFRFNDKKRSFFNSCSEHFNMLSVSTCCLRHPCKSNKTRSSDILMS